MGWKSGLWLQITNIISSTHTSENEQLGNQESQLLVAWNFTCHLFFMRKHEKMFISVQILCKNLRGKEETVPVLKHLQSWNVCLKFLKKSQCPKFSHWFLIRTLNKIFFLPLQIFFFKYVFAVKNGSKLQSRLEAIYDSWEMRVFARLAEDPAGRDLAIQVHKHPKPSSEGSNLSHWKMKGKYPISPS